MSRPQINVTPLIDILLVLLIIFMVITPIKPAAFKARIPAEDRDVSNSAVHPEALIITVRKDASVRLNNEPLTGGVTDTTALTERLIAVFKKRIANGSVDDAAAGDAGRPFDDVAQRTVFIKAPKSLDYGSVARVLDAAKLGGAYPISLQIDDLE